MLLQAARRPTSSQKAIKILQHKLLASPSIRASSSCSPSVAIKAPVEQLDLSPYVSLANKLADAASTITLKYFRNKFDVEIKSDSSPVTIADKETEDLMRDIIAMIFPDHGVFGEEHGIKYGENEGSDYMWVLDPIDGTKSFITGKPLFGTLIALLYRGRPILGIIDQPYTRERWLGVEGRPTTLNGEVLQTRACSSVETAYLYATTPHMFSGSNEVSFNRLRDKVRIPLYGCDCYAYGLLAAGHCDLVVEADLKPYDYMALVPIVKGAGGVMTDWRGNELIWNPPRPTNDANNHVAELKSGWPGEIIAAGDLNLHLKALETLAFK